MRAVNSTKSNYELKQLSLRTYSENDQITSCCIGLPETFNLERIPRSIQRVSINHYNFK